jgi:tetratricopeptide (TPR) repeat protein
MKRALLAAGIAVLCLPMIFVLWLLLAVRWTKMDATTMKLPFALRSMVVEALLQKAGAGPDSGPKLDRVLRIDPSNVKAWGQRCTGWDDKDDPKVIVKACTTAVGFEGTNSNWYGLGRADENAGDYCGAEIAFAKAVETDSDKTDYYDEEQRGQSALRCGHLNGARSGLERAIDLETSSLAQPDQDQDEIDDTTQDLLDDREYLIVTLDRQHETKLAKDVCSVAHPDWSGCACTLDGDSDVSCSNLKH